MKTLVRERLISYLKGRKLVFYQIC